MHETLTLLTDSTYLTCVELPSLSLCFFMILYVHTQPVDAAVSSISSTPINTPSMITTNCRLSHCCMKNSRP